MIPFRRASGRPDDPDSTHDRARSLLSDRLLGRLGEDDEGWLAAHLAGCAGCRAVAAAWEADHALLRDLAAAPPAPPRDLWARTASAIELEAAAAAGGRRTRDRRRSRIGRPSSLPAGLLSIALVVAVVASASLLSGPSAPGSVAPSPGRTPGIALATPLAVTATRVGWLEVGADGTYGLAFAAIDRVCPSSGLPACAPLGDLRPQVLHLAQQPASVVLSPRADQLVVVPDPSGTGPSSGAVLVVPVATASPAAAASPGVTAGPVASPTVGPTPQPSSPATPAVTPPASAPVASPTAAPSSPAAPSRSPGPEPSPIPTPAGTLQIASGVVVVGDTAAYTSDGQWFAFSARPLDGSGGPDIYVWKVGAAAAVRETTDHRSVFAAWLGSVVLGSRVDAVASAEPSPLSSAMATASPAPDPGVSPSVPGGSAGAPSASPAIAYRATSFLLDPATGIQADLASPGLWQPVVDPTRRTVVHWDGTLATDDGGLSWHPAEGNLVLDAWNAPSLPASTTPAAPTPFGGAPSGSMIPTPEPSANPADSGSPPPSPSAGSGIETEVLARGPIGDFDARFDPDGTHLAIWTADPTDPTNPAIGRLTLFAIDPATGSPAATAPLVAAVPALRGFSLQSGRLAWATPEGQDGQGSRLQVVAWSGTSFGSVETIPGGRLLVVH